MVGVVTDDGMLEMAEGHAAQAAASKESTLVLSPMRK